VSVTVQFRTQETEKLIVFGTGKMVDIGRRTLLNYQPVNQYPLAGVQMQAVAIRATAPRDK
jgi:hypothetical protein